MEKKIHPDDVTIFIPTRNEEDGIGEVIDGFKELGYTNILVIDGHSTDRTREIAREKGATVVIQSGKGKGQAVAEAFVTFFHSRKNSNSTSGDLNENTHSYPAYNEELTIGSVVALSKKYGDVLVVDDGSSDRTSEIAKEAGVIVIQHGRNMEKGQALKTAFEYAISKGYDVVVTIDADGQHNPDEVHLRMIGGK